MVLIGMFLEIDAINTSSRSKNKCKKQKSQNGRKIPAHWECACMLPHVVVLSGLYLDFRRDDREGISLIVYPLGRL
jgi:hypothetical protein